MPKTQNKPTPGPWEVCSHVCGERRIYGVRNAKYGQPNPYPGHLVTDPAIPGHYQGAIGSSWNTDNEADARMIAAAPDMLALLRKWSALDGGSWHPRHAREKCELLSETRAVLARIGEA